MRVVLEFKIKFLEVVGIKLSKENNYIKKCFVLRVQEKLDVRDFKFFKFLDWIFRVKNF